MPKGQLGEENKLPSGSKIGGEVQSYPDDPVETFEILICVRYVR